ncbi:cache domain-containing sensor histidine kinase [Paenibacillus hamazuiensis]|uniref:cache domain-containing sensor histidine kinase n=1 Tax=Paenibacillus hamazuiensis TaxID=2936508 RepID=UPI00200D81F1|nr:sensor histidine kinase [Paenibacillus hamazuiensis]
MTIPYKLKQWIMLLFRNLQIRIIVSIVIFVFCAVFLSLQFSFQHTETLFEKETSDLLLSNLEQVGTQVENVTLDMLKLSNVLSSDDVVFSNLNAFHRDPGFKPFDKMKSPQELTPADYLRMSKLENHLNYAKNNIFFNYTAHMILISSDGIVCNVMGNIVSDLEMSQEDLNFKQEFASRLKQEKWFQTLVDRESETLWTVPFSYHIPTMDSAKKYASLARPVKNSYTGEMLGIVMINVDLDDFVSLFTVRSRGTVLLLDSRDQIIKSSGDVGMSDIDKILNKLTLYGNQKGYYIGASNDKSYMVNYYNLNRLGWTIVSVIPYEDVMKNTTSLKQKVLAINYVVFGLFLFMSVMLILLITNPLKRLIKDLRKKKIGIYSLGTKGVSYSNDVYDITKSFDHLFKRVDELVLKVVEDERREQELKYEALKAQINPHFLFNTLNIIKWTAMMNGAVNASNMIADLGQLLEVSMNKGSEEITLKEEKQLVIAYMNIQNARFNDSVELVFEIAPELEDYKIIKLLLQPIVENCVLHGLKNRKSGGIIRISAHVHDGRYLQIDVSDNGEGMTERRIHEVLSDTNTESDYRHKFSGLGLRNIHERLQLRYGEQYGLNIASPREQGTTVSVTFPALRNKEEKVGQSC